VAQTGDLSQTSLPALLVRLHRAKATGALVVSVGPFRKKVYLQQGRVVFSASNDRNDRLGEVLLRRGSITLDAYLEASGAMVPGKRFGTILVERGILTPDKLVWAVKEQVKEIVFSLFGLPAGAFQFNEQEDAGDEMITLNLSTPELIHQGVARMDRVEWALEVFHQKGLRLSLSTPAAAVREVLSLTAPEEAALDAMALPLPVNEIVARVGGAPFSTLKFLWALFVLGVVQPHAPAVQEVRAPDEFPEMEVTGDDLADLI
jgi:hypothetical protein